MFFFCILLLAVPWLLTPAAGFTTSSGFNPLEHLGPNSPYFEPRDPPTSPAPPQGCCPVRAAYLSRHAAIYANDYDYEEYIAPFIAKWRNHTIDWSRIPSLSFLAGWTAPVSEAEEELLTRVGKLEATELGISLSFRYPALKPPRRVWASSAERVAKSAQALIRGFELEENTIGLVTIEESKTTGANSLTPYKSCPAYSPATGAEQMSVFLKLFTRPIIARLNALVPSFNFTTDDVYGMMELCGYESVIRGSSPFCSLDLFSPDEWLAWEYTSDIMSHYNTGYGSRLSGVIGLPWFKTTADLLMAANHRANDQDLHVSFTHRELTSAVLVAMGLFNNSEPAAGCVNNSMPLDHINHRRAWKNSHIMPFIGNLAIEKLSCAGSYGFSDGYYYRALVNNAPQQLPGCRDGPGTSCSHSSFYRYVQSRVSMFSRFSETCGVTDDNAPEILSIYTDPGIGNGTLVGKRTVWE
ncbi:histidine acid phosphatase [Podospora aff. communis PSN243]|uniref:Histidine acid phosphatase n=1 Tax=Podospora aff. communis PSN243 TaxID=3040156 RepID=A0AAV9GTJ4_9PEZI|nr:histidine acid phosphatase [Podospora aff. communis PSN243]